MLRWPWRRSVVTRPFDSAQGKQLDPQTAYAVWAPNYPPRPHNRLMEVEQGVVLSLLPDVHGLTALDAGCGSGRYLKVLHDRGAVAIGVDLSIAMLARAQQVGSRIARADLCALPFDAMSLDLVVCGLALGDIAELELALTEIARVLRPGGRVIYSVVHPAGAAAGWSRTFEAEGRQCAIKGHWHSVVEHRRACAAAGLTIDAWHEPVLDEAPDQPALLIVRARTAVERPLNDRRTNFEHSS